MNKSDLYEVVVCEYGIKDPVKIIPCETELKAVKTEKDLNMNLNHDKFYTDTRLAGVIKEPFDALVDFMDEQLKDCE